MTSEEVKELLRQLSKDTQEVGDVRSRTVRIRLGGDEEPEVPEEDNEPEGTGKIEGNGRSEGTGRAGRTGKPGETGKMEDFREIEETGETEEAGEMPEPEAAKKEQLPDREKKGQVSAFLSRFGKNKGKSGADSRRDNPEDRQDGQENAPGMTGEEDDSRLKAGGEDDTSRLEAEDDFVTRYMDEEEKKAYLEEKTGIKADRRRPGPEAVKRTAGPGLKGRFNAFMERQRETPVEPAAFDEDAWMFRSGGADEAMQGVSDGEDLREDAPAGLAEDETVPLKEKSREVLGFLEGKGIGLKELAIIGSIIVLSLLILAIILTLVGNKRKSARVTADEGLRITVEKEPSKWCRSGDVTLRVAADSPIQSISMNGQPLSFMGQGRVTVTFTAEENPAELMVVSEDKVRTASVGFSRIDGVDPVVNISSQDGTITFEASDEGSGVDKIWYGMLEGLSEVPSYQEYKGPFEPEKGRMYSYFATDRAGNASEPVSTNLTPAESISLSRDEVSVFAGETYTLALTIAPEKAFLNDLTWISSDETVATVSSEGVVTALKDGEAVITARAEGVADADCTIRVRSEVSVTISAVGDVTLGEDISFSPVNNFTSVYTMNGPAYFLQNVRDIFNADDVTFANLEGTLTEQGTREPKEYAFRGDPSYVQVLTEGSVEAVTLANNHSHDYGEVSHTDTQKVLDEAGIAWCDGDDIILQDVSGVRMAFIGIYALMEGKEKAEQVESCIARAKEEGAQLIVVAFHWGNERESKPDETQKYLAHLAVDSGADLVVGHHPHVLQGIEKYSGKYICYSLANFCFGGNSNPSDKDTMIFQQTFRILRGGTVEDGGVSVIPCSISSTPEWNNYQPTPATGEEAERIMARINELCEPFKTSF